MVRLRGFLLVVVCVLGGGGGVGKEETKREKHTNCIQLRKILDVR